MYLIFPYDTKNSKQIRDSIKTLNIINKDKTMVSYDAESLITNVLQNEINKILDKKWPEIKPCTAIKNKTILV